MKDFIFEEHHCSFRINFIKNRNLRIIVDNNDLHFIQKEFVSFNIKEGERQVVCMLKGRQGTKQFARALLGLKDDKLVVDHINRNPLDNRRANLRIANRTQNNANSGLNSRNTSGYKGVSYNSKTKKYQVSVAKIYMGAYSDPLEAAKHYDKCAIKTFGKFACTNKSLGLL